MRISDTQLHKLLGSLELIDEAKLADAQVKAKEAKQPLDQYLIAHEYIKDAELGQVVADHFKLGFIDLAQERVDSALAGLVPESVARAQQVVAYRRDDERVYVATADPSNFVFLKSLEQKIGQPLAIAYATPSGIAQALHVYKSDVLEDITELIATITKNPQDQDRIVHLVDALVEYAHDSGASDIHLEPNRKQLTLRLRIDGVMHTVIELPKVLAELILTRLKIMAKLRTDEHRRPQDGKFRFNTPDGYIDVRVSMVPVTAGENVVMRLLATQGQRFPLSDLGLAEADLKKVRTAIQNPHGMILTTGPTGSGKTTTLYAMLQILSKPEVSVATIEDPVEYDMPSVSQIQVNVTADLTFAKGLRSIVRQDPDIIMVGEIRDQETAGIAVNSAMTGHLVLSTLHANNAATAFPRLLDMDIEPFLVGSTVNVVIAQRLVRQICTQCRASYKPDAKEKRMITSDPELKTWFASRKGSTPASLRLYKGTGCSACNNTGYKGRAGIFEVMDMNEQIKALVLARASSDQIMATARKQGMTTMLEDGLAKALNGLTTLEEVMRVTKS